MMFQFLADCLLCVPVCAALQVLPETIIRHLGLALGHSSTLTVSSVVVAGRFSHRAERTAQLQLSSGTTRFVSNRNPSSILGCEHFQLLSVCGQFKAAPAPSTFATNTQTF